MNKYELIIAEKPSAAKKIAQALSTGKLTVHNDKKVTDYKLKFKDKEIVVVNAVGHLFGLKQKTKTRKYPVFDIEWAPSSEINKTSKFTKRYLDRIKKLAKNASEFTVATDYDIEGEVIGWNIIRFVCKQKDANRMKFSTTTKQDLIDAYKKKQKTLDWGQAYAGETRHKLDWFYGINLSKALTHSVALRGRYKTMSTGRVQGPLLKILVDKEKSIKEFKPEPYWEIHLKIKKNNKEFVAEHKENKFFEKSKFEKRISELKDCKKAKIKDIKRTEKKQNPPNPFDLTALQIEAYKVFKINPKETLSIAQDLYTNSYISYPRTSSNQLPKEIKFRNILQKLGKSQKYQEFTTQLLKNKTLKPNNGTKKDPAHPAIYPTGELPKNLNPRAQKIYDLIVKRFFATFGKPAIRETQKITIDANKQEFILKGTITKVKNWFELYKPYVILKEEPLENFEIGEELNCKAIHEEKQTQPPKRYTQASIIKELEKRNLGTKATRASILDTLFLRGYIKNNPIEVTEIGIKTEAILEEFFPRIVDEKLTRSFEEDMELIRQGKKTEEEVLEEAKKIIVETIDEFKTKKEKVGEALIKASDEQRKAENYFGKCPVCGEELTKRKGKYGEFIACTAYPKCKFTVALPKGRVEFAGEHCPECKYPMLIIKSKKNMKICSNPNCPAKKIDPELKKLENKTCPKCGKGKLVIKKGVYGVFLACNRYPECKYIENIKKT